MSQSLLHWSNPTMQVFGPFRMNPTQGPQPQTRPSGGVDAAAAPQRNAGSIDQLDLSPQAREAGRSEGPATVGGEMRLDKVAELRRQIAEGSYDTEEKLDIALGRMFDQLG
jgi:anti-sigma28 factor (negative regulator of flagellin synthesis)